GGVEGQKEQAQEVKGGRGGRRKGNAERGRSDKKNGAESTGVERGQTCGANERRGEREEVDGERGVMRLRTGEEKRKKGIRAEKEKKKRKREE
ncbi:hypothetical protein, partial [Salmonella enterica]|uniref:hypothetical protein n=1 Tax=Salmonella enterica TaxID=28901 RepID=UPI00398C6D98